MSDETTVPPANEPKFIFPDLTWAMLLLRLWIGLRMLLAGWVK